MLRVLVLLVLLVANTTWGQAADSTVTGVELGAAVKNISEGLPVDDPQRESLLKSYSDTRAALLRIKQHEQARDNFVQARANAAVQTQSIQEELSGSRAAPEQDDKAVVSASLQELEQMIQVDKAELDARGGQLADIRADIDAMPGRPAEIRQRVTELVGLSTELESQLGLMNKKVEGGSEDEARAWLVQAQLASAAMEKTALDEELLSQPMRLDLLKAQLDQTRYDTDVLKKRIQTEEKRAGELRQGKAVQARAKAERVLAQTEGKHELVQQLADRNAELTASFVKLGDAIKDIHERESFARNRADQLETDLKSIERKLHIVGMTAVVGEILREQQAQLPGHRESQKAISAIADDITTSSMRQVELEDERRQLRNESKYIAQLVQGLDAPTVALISDDLAELLDNRRESMRQAVDLENTYAMALGDLDFTLRRYTAVVDQYRGFISERLLWIPSRGTLSVFRGGGLVVQVAEVFAPGRWLRVVQSLPGEIVGRPLTSVAILLVLILIYFSPLLYRRLVSTGRQVGYVRSDHISSTIRALGLSLLLSLKWPMLLSTVAWLFEMQDKESELAMALYMASVRTAIYFWGLEFLRMTLLPKGLVDAHFRWPAKRTATLCRRIARLEQTFLPSVFLFAICIELYPREVGGPLGALAIIAVLLSIAQFFRLLPSFAQGKMQMMISDGTPREGSFWGRLVRVLLVWVPLGATVAVLLGYTYTAREFAVLLVETIVLFSSVLMFHELGLRWLRLARRRMTYKVRQEHAKANQEESEISVEDELLESDPDLLSDEGTKLLNVLTLFAGLAGIALIWAEVFPALRILDSVELWHQTGMVDGREVPVPVSLGDVFSAAAIAIIGWVALRRIPSLLEILLRQRVNVRPASAYAATRVFQYGATTVLIISVLGMLGGSWGQIQWAVAALSVGIGFGLQEIVANFICGLIILFEQPIRVGDTITVGDVSGKVTRINMRATTVRDFDRRELLVPNKEFITTQLLNWSLSDQVTRRILEVGVAYGTDMDKAMAIVRDVALEHPLVLVDPESIITFEEFGDNSLLISLRFFLDQLEQRIIIASDLRLEINRRFNEVGIVVAFPQRDIHFDASEPLAIKMVEA